MQLRPFEQLTVGHQIRARCCADKRHGANIFPWTLSIFACACANHAPQLIRFLKKESPTSTADLSRCFGRSSITCGA